MVVSEWVCTHGGTGCVHRAAMESAATGHSPAPELVTSLRGRIRTRHGTNPPIRCTMRLMGARTHEVGKSS